MRGDSVSRSLLAHSATWHNTQLYNPLLSREQYNNLFPILNPHSAYSYEPADRRNGQENCATRYELGTCLLADMKLLSFRRQVSGSKLNFKLFLHGFRLAILLDCIRTPFKTQRIAMPQIAHLSKQRQYH